jgi:hypothetical protein
LASFRFVKPKKYPSEDSALLNIIRKMHFQDSALCSNFTHFIALLSDKKNSYLESASASLDYAISGLDG